MGIGPSSGPSSPQKTCPIAISVYFTRATQKVERRPGGEEIESPRLPSPESSARLPIFSSTAFVSHRENQICVRPPSTTSSDPVMKEESSLARNRAAFAISPASPKR